MVKPTFNTYSRKKTKSIKPKVDYHFHVHVNNFVTNNVFLGSSDSSVDEFDKLLRGTSCQQGSSHSRSTNIIKKEQFWPRQETLSFYNSDATPVSSSLSSAHLFRDTFGDSSELSSLSTPPSYNHFLLEDYERDLKSELLNLPRKKKLKQSASQQLTNTPVCENVKTENEIMLHRKKRRKVAEHRGWSLGDVTVSGNMHHINSLTRQPVPLLTLSFRFQILH
ncbi:hypothetical protein J6590_001775 [Homalodisca vitripennis]|nr:hypothetical protein J6590_001775 [Homalodisca vitripennis]